MADCNRRNFFGVSGASAVAAMGMLGERMRLMRETTDVAVADTGRTIKHSVCKWCYKDIPLETLCAAGKEFGIESVEIIRPDQAPILKKYGMTCAMAANPTITAKDGKTVGGIVRGWNQVEYHDVLVEGYEHYIKSAADAGFKNVICFSGNRRGMDDELGLKNCALGLQRLMPICERHGMTLSMELLNSKVNHKDYMCDRTNWGVELCRMIGSDNFKLLYDIYHMQIMEGDVIATIREHHTFISHYHTGGVPGRNEIDDTQELYYPAIVKAILETGYQGYLGQEFIPRAKDKISSLKQGVSICNVSVG